MYWAEGSEQVWMQQDMGQAMVSMAHWRWRALKQAGQLVSSPTETRAGKGDKRGRVSRGPSLIWLPGNSRMETRKTVTKEGDSITKISKFENWRRAGKQEKVLPGRGHRAEGKGAAARRSQQRKNPDWMTKEENLGQLCSLKGYSCTDRWGKCW